MRRGRAHGTTEWLKSWLIISALVVGVRVLAGLLAALGSVAIPGGLDDVTLPIEASAATAAAGLLTPLLYLVTAFMFLRWIYRMNRYLRDERNRDLRYGPWASVIWFFIPFASLIMPYRIVTDIKEAAQSGAHRSQSAMSAGVWWILILSQIAVSDLSQGVIVQSPFEPANVQIALLDGALASLQLLGTYVSYLLVKSVGNDAFDSPSVKTIRRTAYAEMEA